MFQNEVFKNFVVLQQRKLQIHIYCDIYKYSKKLND